MRRIILLLFLLPAGFFAGAQTDSTCTEKQVDKQARFDGGLYAFIMKTLVVPEEVKSDGGAAGRIIIQFMVSREGLLSDFTILHHSNFPALDTAVLKTMEQSPPWLPAQKNGRPVASYFRMPLQLCFRD